LVKLTGAFTAARIVVSLCFNKEHALSAVGYTTFRVSADCEEKQQPVVLFFV